MSAQITLTEPLSPTQQQEIMNLTRRYRTELNDIRRVNGEITRKIESTTAQAAGLKKTVEKSERLNKIVLKQLQDQVASPRQGLDTRRIYASRAGALITGLAAGVVLTIAVPGAGIPTLVGTVAAASIPGLFAGGALHDHLPSIVKNEQNVRDAQKVIEGLSNYLKELIQT